MASDDSTLEVLSDSEVQDGIAFLRASLKTCSEVNVNYTLDLCASYICAFIMRVLLNQGLLSPDYLNNELQYFGTKFIIDFTTKTTDGCGTDE